MKYIISAESGISDYYFCSKIINGSNPASIHSHIELIFVLKGKLSVTIDKNTHIITKGNSVIIMPYEVHSYTTESESEIFIIACPPDYMPELKQDLTGKYFVPPVAKFSMITVNIINDILNSDFRDDLKKKALLYYTLSEFNNNCTLEDKEAMEFDLYRTAIAYISEHFRENITLETVAEKVGVTSSHLSRVLNGGCKSSFPDIINSLRIFYAKRLLETTPLSISEIAFESGYGSIRNFNRIFKSHFGSNPKDIKSPKKQQA